MAAGYLDILTTSARSAIADDAGFDLTNDAEWRVDLAANDWTPAAGATYIVDRWLTTGSFRSWNIDTSTAATMGLSVENGSGAFRATFTSSFSKPSDGERCQLRWTLDANNGSSQTVVAFYSRRGASIQDLESDSDWVLEDTDTLGGVQTWKASTSQIALHSQSEGGPANGVLGKYYRAVMWSDLTKTTKCFDVNFGDDANQVGGDPALWDDAARSGNWSVSGVEDTDFAWVAEGAPGGYLVHEADGTSKFTLEDDSGFLILEETEVTVDATATPATVNAPAAVPASTRTASVEKPATTVAAVAAVPASTQSASVEKTATTVNAVAIVPAVTKTASADKTAVTVNVAAAIPLPVTIGGTTALPATVNLTAGIPAVTKTASVEKTATTVNAVGAVPAAGKSASVEKTATTVNVIAAVPASTRTASVEKAATTVNVVAGVPAPTETASVEKPAVTVPVVAFIPLPTVTAGGNATVTPNTVPAAATVPQATLTASSTKTATTVNVIAAVPAVVKSASVEKSPATVNVVTGVPATTETASSTFAPLTVTVVAGIPFVTVDNGGPPVFYNMETAGPGTIGAETGGTSSGIEADGVGMFGVESGGLLVGVEA